MPPRFFLLHGPDEFASAEFVEALKAKLGDPTFAELNTAVFDGRTATLADVRATPGVRSAVGMLAVASTSSLALAAVALALRATASRNNGANSVTQ